MQITIGSKNGETFQKEVETPENLIGKEIGEEFKGELLNIPGYKLEITGGSDKDGFPMRKTISGTERQKRLLKKGTGIRNTESGVRRRKSVRGKRVSNQIQQLNTKVIENGDESLEELLNNEEE